MVAQLPKNNDELTIAQQEFEAELDALAELIASEKPEEPAYETAITDLSALAGLVALLEEAQDRGETDRCNELFERIGHQVKCVATIHFNYNREVLDGYQTQMKADGLKSVLIPTDFKGCWHVA